MTKPVPKPVPQPVVKAFLVCDQVIQDAQSGKKSLIGVFQELRAERFPAVHPQLWIYGNLTDGHGRYTLEIRLVDVEQGQVLSRGEPPPLDISGPLQVTEISAQLRNITLPRAGMYEFHLLSNGQVIASKAIHATQVVPPARGPRPERPG
ncbi:MAG: DUF6941 family protein [Planctomycetia bacterium]